LGLILSKAAENAFFAFFTEQALRYDTETPFNSPQTHLKRKIMQKTVMNIGFAIRQPEKRVKNAKR